MKDKKCKQTKCNMNLDAAAEIAPNVKEPRKNCNIDTEGCRNTDKSK